MYNMNYAACNLKLLYYLNETLNFQLLTVFYKKNRRSPDFSKTEEENREAIQNTTVLLAVLAGYPLPFLELNYLHRFIFGLMLLCLVYNIHANYALWNNFWSH